MPRVTKEWLKHIPCDSDPYWVRVRERAKELNTDGCSKVKDWWIDSCYEHDIHYKTGKNIEGDCITESEANSRFRRVIQSRSGWWNPLVWTRYLGVKIGQPFHKNAKPEDCK